MDLKAYHVQEDFEASCCIVFATNGASARRQGAMELGVEWEDVEFCRRAHWADLYVDQREVPPQVLIEQGWKVTCGCCGNWIDQDLIDESEGGCAPVYVGRWAYFNLSHHDQMVADMKARYELEAAVKSEAEALFPGIEVVRHFDGKGSSNSPGVTMRVPGLAGTVDWQRDESFVSVEKRDLEAWKSYQSQIRQSA